jgi:UDP-glucose 4-epimerase
VPAAVHFVPGAIGDAEVVRTVFQEHRIDYVFHLAAYAAEGLSHFIRRFNYANNVIGSVTLINEAVNAGTVRCFVFTSSIAVYGHAASPVTEETPPAPVDPYGIAKLAVELDLWAARQTFGLPFIIFRPHNVYGERQNISDPYRNVIGIFMNQILRGQPMTVFGDGLQSRAFTYISDVAPAIAASVERTRCYDSAFNVGADEVYSVIDVAGLVARAMGVEPNIRHVEERQEVAHISARHDRLRREFGDVQASVPLQAGLERMAAWARTQTLGPRPAFRSVEVDRDLPPVWQGAPASPESA